MVKLDESRAVEQLLGETHADTSWDQAPARIKVVGVGGGGCNCVRRMSDHSVPGVRFVMVNTDIKSLEPVVHGAEVVQIGKKITQGWGAGGDALLGQKAAEESVSLLRNSLKDAELVFITAGMGGGTGSGAAPYVAYLAKEMGALVVGVVTTPFSFEGTRRIGQAIAGVDQLRPYVDNLVVIHNDRLLQYVNHDAEMIEAFRTADEVVTRGILSLSELINLPGEINVDFADVRSIMEYPGGALMAIGLGHGKMGAVEAARQAIANPLLNLSIKGAKGVLFCVKGGEELTLGGVNAAGELIGNHVRKNAAIFFGMSLDHTPDDNVKLTLIATGLKEQGVSGSIGDRVRRFKPRIPARKKESTEFRSDYA
ncbi:MAG: cell division protein FtsZ [Dehalococcoidia bacterium]